MTEEIERWAIGGVVLPPRIAASAAGPLQEVLLALLSMQEGVVRAWPPKYSCACLLSNAAHAAPQKHRAGG